VNVKNSKKERAVDEENFKLFIYILLIFQYDKYHWRQKAEKTIARGDK
jgi:hypothetical protein